MRLRLDGALSLCTAQTPIAWPDSTSGIAINALCFRGTVNGALLVGRVFHHGPADQRPSMFNFVACINATISGLTLRSCLRFAPTARLGV
jgi:hypothetical protein